MKIVTADGLSVSKAYFNAWHLDQTLEGVRIGIEVLNGCIVASVHSDDLDAVADVDPSHMSHILEMASVKAQNGDVDMCDEREVEAWMI